MNKERSVTRALLLLQGSPVLKWKRQEPKRSKHFKPEDAQLGVSKVFLGLSWGSPAVRIIHQAGFIMFLVIMGVSLPWPGSDGDIGVGM